MTKSSVLEAKQALKINQDDWVGFRKISWDNMQASDALNSVTS